MDDRGLFTADGLHGRSGNGCESILDAGTRAGPSMVAVKATLSRSVAGLGDSWAGCPLAR